MTVIDYRPLYRSVVGFDRLGRMLDEAYEVARDSATSPRYDIVKLDADTYRITMAVAGFAQDDLDIVSENDVLTVKGTVKDEPLAEGSRVLHQGIARSAFERRFQLADHVEVDHAELRDGLLHITLVRRVPEALKPKRIDISAGSTPTTTAAAA